MVRVVEEKVGATAVVKVLEDEMVVRVARVVAERVVVV